MSNPNDTTAIFSDGEMKNALASPEQKAAGKTAALVVIEGAFKTTIFELSSGDVTVGRSSDNSIFLNCKGVSRHHLKLSVDENFSSVILEDLGSTNGTYLNNVKIKEPISLKKGDVINIGRTAFKFLPKGDPDRLTYDRLQMEACIDGLTGCFNKTYFNNAMAIEVKRSQRTNLQLSLVVFDLDHFKKLNDTYGHDAGDYVLANVAKVIRSSGIREYDIFSRYGGEEFVVLLPKTNPAQAWKIAERFRTLIEKHDFIYDNSKLLVTISVGVADLQQDVSTEADLFKRADAAMYHSKREGRNRTTFYKP